MGPLQMGTGYIGEADRHWRCWRRWAALDLVATTTAVHTQNKVKQSQKLQTVKTRWGTATLTRHLVSMSVSQQASRHSFFWAFILSYCSVHKVLRLNFGFIVAVDFSYSVSDVPWVHSVQFSLTKIEIRWQTRDCLSVIQVVFT